MTDIVARLREQPLLENGPLCQEAADEIERLRKDRDYWHMRYAEVCRRRSVLDRINAAPLLGSEEKP